MTRRKRRSGAPTFLIAFAFVPGFACTSLEPTDETGMVELGGKGGCGNGTCSGKETCSSCPADCGPCSSGSSSSSSSSAASSSSSSSSTGGGTTCTNPAVDVVVQPGASIQAAVDSHPEGTSFLLAAGVFRMQSVSPKAGNSFHGTLDGSCERLTTMTGARVLTSWTQQGSVWWVGGQTQQGQVHGDCESGWERCNRPEDLFVDNVLVRHVTALDQVGPGTWYFDYDSDRIYVGDNPSGHAVEVGVTRVAFSPTAPNVRVEGLIVEKYAIPPQMGAIGDQYPANGWRVEGNEVRYNHGSGIRVANDSVVSRNFVHHNGQMGIGAIGSGVVIELNEIADNNIAHVQAGWEAGGTKFAYTTGLTVRANCVHHNRGPGLWTDIENMGTLYEDNVVFSNVGMGIFHEISFDAVIRNNLVGDNGYDFAWLYGAQILVSTSQNVEVYGNTVEVSPLHGNGIGVIWQNRPPYAGTGSSLHHNDVTFLGDGAIWQGTAAITGVAADFEPATTQVFLTNSMNSNAYHMKNTGTRHFAWQNGMRTFTELKAAGQELQGSVDANVVPRQWNCDTVLAP